MHYVVHNPANDVPALIALSAIVGQVRSEGVGSWKGLSSTVEPQYQGHPRAWAKVTSMER